MRLPEGFLLDTEDANIPKGFEIDTPQISPPEGFVLDMPGIVTLPEELTPEMEDMAYEKYRESVAPIPGQRVMGFSKADFIRQPDMARKWAELVPKTRSHFEKLSESWQRGKENFLIDLNYFDAVILNQGDPDEIYKLYKLSQTRNQLDPIKGKNLLEEMEYGTSSILPGMLEGAKQSLPEITAGVVAGIPGGPPGVAAGLSIGFKVGSTYAWYRQGAGEMLLNMRDKGLNNRYAKVTAAVAGVPYALIEQMQIGQVIPGLREGVNAVVNKSLTNFALKVVKQYGKTVTQETLEEVAQEAVAIIAEDIASYLSSQGIKMDKTWAKEQAQRLWDTTKGAAISMALLPVPGAIFDLAQVHNIRAVENPTVADDIAAVEDVKATINESTELSPDEKDVGLKYVGDIETKIVNNIVDKFPEPITNQESLERIGNEIKNYLGITQDVKWVWNNRKTKNRMAYHRTRTGAITVFGNGDNFVKEIGYFWTSPGHWEDVPNKTPGRTNQDLIKKVLVHELGHTEGVAPSIREPGRRRVIHHKEFVQWANENVKRLVETQEVVEPVHKPEAVGPIIESAIVNKIIVETHNKTGGSTIDRTGKPVEKGFAVAISKDFEKILPTDKITEQDIDVYKKEHADYLSKNPDAVVGTWVENGKTYLDISRVVPTKEEAVSIGRLNKQLAIFDLGKKESVPVEKLTTEAMKTKPSLIDKLFKKYPSMVTKDITQGTAHYVAPDGRILNITGATHFTLARSIKSYPGKLLNEGMMRTRSQEAGILIEFGKPPTDKQVEIASNFARQFGSERGTVVSWYGDKGEIHQVNDSYGLKKPTQVLNQALEQMQEGPSITEGVRKRLGFEAMAVKPKIIPRSKALSLGHQYPKILGWSEEQRRGFMAELVGKSSMKDMTPEEYTKTVEEMERLIREKGLANKLPGSRKTAEEKVTKLILGDTLVNFSKLLDEAVEIVKKLPAQWKPTGVITRFKGRWGRNMLSATKDFFLGMDNDNPAVLAYKLSGGKKSAITTILDDNIRFGKHRSAAILRGGIDFIRDLNKESGITDEDLAELSRSNYQRLELVKNIREMAKISKTKLYDIEINGKKFEVEMGQLEDFYLCVLQEDGLKHIKKTGIWLNNIFTGPMDDATISKLRNMVDSNPKAKQSAINKSRTLVEHDAPAINLVSNREMGEDICDNEHYWHLEIKTFKTLKGKGIIPFSFLDNPRILRERTHSGKGALVIRDAYDKFLAIHFASAEYVGLTEPLRAARTLLNYEPLIGAIESKGYGKLRENIITVFDRAQTATRTGGYISRAIAMILHGGYRSVLATPEITLAQWFSTFQYAGIVDVKYLNTIGQGSTVSRVKRMLDHNDVSWVRLNMSHQSLEMAETGKLDATLRAFTGKTGDINKLMMGPKFTDIAALSEGYLMSENIIKDSEKFKFESPEYWNAVNDFAEDLWFRTQPSWDKWGRSVNTSDPTVLRQTIFLFRSYYEKALSMLHRADAEYNGSEKTIEDKKKWAKVYGSVLASQALSAAMKTLMGWALWRQKKTLWDWIIAMVSAPAAMIPVLGSFIQAITARAIKILTKDKPGPIHDPVSMLPVTLVNTALKGVAQMTDAAMYFASGDEERARKQLDYALKNIYKGLGAIHGWPISLMERFRKGWMIKGKENTMQKKWRKRL